MVVNFTTHFHAIFFNEQNNTIQTHTAIQESTLCKTSLYRQIMISTFL